MGTSVRRLGAALCGLGLAAVMFAGCSGDEVDVDAFIGTEPEDWVGLGADDPDDLRVDDGELLTAGAGGGSLQVISQARRTHEDVVVYVQCAPGTSYDVTLVLSADESRQGTGDCDSTSTDVIIHRDVPTDGVIGVEIEDEDDDPEQAFRVALYGMPAPG